MKEIDTKGKTVLVRADLNVPIKEGKVTSDLRIKASVPTIEYLRGQGAKVVVISHLGRPEGKKSKEMSLLPVAEGLREILAGGAAGGPGGGEKGKNVVKFVPETTGEKVQEAVMKLKPGEVLLLENLRFDPREEENDEGFAKEIIEATGAEVFVQDGFAVVHRAHASTDAIARLVPSVAGLLLEKEVATLTEVMDRPEHPVVIVIGGSKVEDKQPLIEKFLGTADKILVGGKIAADGYVPSNTAGEKIYVAEDFDEDATGARLDIGPVSTAKFAEAIADAKTVIWNGALGKVEDPAYDAASAIVATVMGEKRDATTVVCGGDTTGFVEKMQEAHPGLSFSLVSTGGGAALEFLLGKKLPGIEVLAQNKP